MNYKLAYRMGFHPGRTPRRTFRSPRGSQDYSTRRRAGEPPYGSALGTGSGIWAIQLATRGWQVTGVDLVEKALQRARERVESAGADVRLVPGDVTALRAAGMSTGFRLLLDTGTFHGLKDDQRLAMGAEVSAVAASDATVLLLAWPSRWRPLIRGVSHDEIAAAFPGWTLTDLGPSHVQAPKPIELLLRPDEHWYRLRRD